MMGAVYVSQPFADPLADFRSGSMEPWTVDVLCALVRAQRPHMLIETGTFEARTTRRLFEAMNSYGAMHGSSLFTIESDVGFATAAWETIAGFQTAYTVTALLVQADALAYLRSRPPEWADFIFLDDDHDQQHVYEELIEAKRVLCSGGICCIHDVVGPFKLDQVVRTHGGVVLDLPRLHVAGGLGIVTK